MEYNPLWNYFINQGKIEKKLDKYLKENNEEIDGFLIDSYESLSTYIYSKIDEQIAKDFTDMLKLADVGDINKFSIGNECSISSENRNNNVFDVDRNTMTNYFAIDRRRINYEGCK